MTDDTTHHSTQAESRHHPDSTPSAESQVSTRDTSRKQGILLHPTSLPSPEGIGGLGVEAHNFLDWLTRCGARAWQMLPLVPIGAGHSPYSSSSAFAGNALLVSLEKLTHEGWIISSEYQSYLDDMGVFGLDQVDYPQVIQHKNRLLSLAADRYLNALPDGTSKATDEIAAGYLKRFETFRYHQRDWLEDAALFDVISSETLTPWWEWPITIRQRQSLAIQHAKRRFKPLIDRYIVIQMWFQEQWDELRAAANHKGIELIGDVPIYVDHNSADVWAHPELFELDDTGLPLKVAGVPPDAFSETGQLWGSPLYQWSAHADESFAWWRRRLSRALALTHTVRIDHFRAFAAYWAVPYGAQDAREGEWLVGPGMTIFEALSSMLSVPQEHKTLSPLIAEDLGLIDEPVRDLLKRTSLPGMKVLQFAFNGDPHQEYLPHNYQSSHCVVYTGTHDNQTTRGWWETLSEQGRDQVRRYCSCSGDPSEISWDIIRLAIASVATIAIIPLQDILALGDNARMNQPSLPEGNWTWRVRHEALNPDVSRRLYELNAQYGRLIKDDISVL
jgi:4-alpha-glucanotransferase